MILVLWSTTNHEEETEEVMEEEARRRNHEDAIPSILKSLARKETQEGTQADAREALGGNQEAPRRHPGGRRRGRREKEEEKMLEAKVNTCLSKLLLV